MKIKLLIIIAVIYFCKPGVSVAESDNGSLVDAIQFLQHNSHIYSYEQINNIKDPAQRQEMEAQYQQTRAAIQVIAKSKNPSEATILMPYLNCSDQEPEIYSRNLVSKPRTLEELRSDWPAFSALIDIPGSSKIVADYILDVKNSLDWRISAFIALRYIDKNEFQKVAKILDKEFVSSDGRALINLVKSGTIAFDGVRPYSKEIKN